jgi:hypothetical protein
MSTDDREMEQRLREELAATADTVQPGGDGLMRIQQRIGERRDRQRWLRPVLVLGSVVVVAAVAVGGVTIARQDNKAKVDVGQDPGTPAETFPSRGFFPFTSASEEADWEQQYPDGHSPWIADPVGVATSWVPNYLKAENVDQVVDKQQTATTADVTLGRNQSEGGLQPVVVVHLVKFGNAWIVTGAGDPDAFLTISSPTAGDTVASPLTVSGPGFGVDEVAKVELREAETPKLIAEAPTDGFGSGTPEWSTSLSFARPQTDVGVVVAMTFSAADGGVSRLAAEKVVFDRTSAPAAAGAGFYGVQGGVIERFDSTGKAQGPVHPGDSDVFEVRNYGGTLYFTVREADCISKLASRAPGQSGDVAVTIATADPGYGIVGFDLNGDRTKLAYFESGCGDLAGTGKLVFEDTTTGDRTAIAFPSEPPAVLGDPMWESDGVHVDAYLRTGMHGYIARYDATAGKNQKPGTNACGEYDPATQLTGAMATDPDGTLWFAGQTGQSMQVLSCRDGMPNVELTVSVNDSPTALAVDQDGKILLTDSSGRVWTGSAGGTARELPVGGGVTYATW